MELPHQTFSYRLDEDQFNILTFFGNFGNSAWSIMFDSTNGEKKETFMNYIVEGEGNLLFPLSNYSVSLPVRQLRVIISISQIHFPSIATASVSQETEASNNSLTESIPPEKFQPSPQLSDDFLSLLNNPDLFPDVTFKCGAEEILVHKAILSARSPVFAAMFKNEMQESDSGVVEIVDIDPDALLATLKFVYGGKTDHLINDGIAGDVLFAANKYQLEELKKVCVDKLKSSMTVDNVFHVLALGHLHDESLKTQAKEFICKCGKFSSLEKTEGWKTLQSENPGLAMEVLLFVVNFTQK